MLTHDSSLEDEVGSGHRRPVRAIQQQSEDVGGQAERRVGHDSERLLRHPQSTKVGGDHANPLAQAAAVGSVTETTSPLVVDLDRPDPGASFRQRQREGTGASPEVDDQFASCDIEVVDELANEAFVSEEVLAECPTAAVPLGTSRAPGHVPSP